jgi:hypothetical protein
MIFCVAYHLPLTQKAVSTKSFRAVVTVFALIFEAKPRKHSVFDPRLWS